MKSCTLSELGVFVRECSVSDEERFQQDAIAAWIGNHYDDKKLNAFINKSKQRRTVRQSPDNEHVVKEWKRLAGALGSLR